MGELIPDVSQRVARHGDVESREEAGRVVVVRHRFGAAGSAVVRALRGDPDLTVRLDELGSAAWRLMDGRRTVADIRRALALQFPDQPELGARLGKFLGTMVSRELVKLQ